MALNDRQRLCVGGVDMKGPDKKGLEEGTPRWHHFVQGSSSGKRNIM